MCEHDTPNPNARTEEAEGVNYCSIRLNINHCQPPLKPRVLIAVTISKEFLYVRRSVTNVIPILSFVEFLHISHTRLQRYY